MYDTIAAISTPQGEGGIAVIRISGTDAVKIADKVFKGKAELSKAATHTVHYGHIVNKAGEIIDEVLVTVMLAPKSFTTEDTVEISTHGGQMASRAVLSELMKNGARHAEPGEFTKRAFLNGRIDLSQAEAVIDMINAKNEISQHNAMSQLKGSLSKATEEIRASLVDLSAHMQVAIDYPDEDLEDVTVTDIIFSVSKALDKAQELLDTADCGRIIRDGVKTVIAGKPNVGKSSLLNTLARTERAIVTDIAGTTRDTIEEYINLNGVPLILIDTAGVRSTDDEVEKIGVERSIQSIEDADLVIVMLDGSDLIDDEDREVLRLTRGKNRVILINKTDLIKNKYTEAIKARANGSCVMEISAKTGAGINELAKYIENAYKIGSIAAGDGAIITNMRHKAALAQTVESLKSAKDALMAGMPQDIAAIDIYGAIDALGKITGATVSEDIVNTIFHRFCVGK